VKWFKVPFSIYHTLGSFYLPSEVSRFWVSGFSRIWNGAERRERPGPGAFGVRRKLIKDRTAKR
jgi:hypothetical protein